MTPPQVSYKHTRFATGSFCDRKREVVRANTLLYQLQVLKDTGRYDAFKLKWHSSYNDKPDHWPVPNHLFWESDVGKWIEGACYFLREQSDKQVEQAVFELVDMIEKAQQPDGYLNIHFTVVEPEKRFTNLRDLHELDHLLTFKLRYNAGHLIEAALAHHDLYGNRQFLDVMIRNVNLFCKTFGPDQGQKHAYPGHPEIELALIRLYEVTRDPAHLKLAQYFITERGNPTGVNGKHYYTVEAEARGELEYQRPSYYPQPKSYWYQQAHKPIVEQETIEGHSVRAMYLLTALAQLQELAPSPDYKKALDRLWTNMTAKKMYLTGGIGAIKQWEGFGIDYFLPHGTDEGGCYAETCASIGVMMLAERMLQFDLDVKYADAMELCFLNAVLTGMSCDGKAFTYVNQLASTDADLSKREEWFTCACCPPNVTRTLGMLGGYFWSFDTSQDDSTAEINVHMYGSATLNFAVGDRTVTLEQRSDWPWKSDIDFELNSGQVKTNIRLRIPAWASGWTIEPAAPSAEIIKGYLRLDSQWLSQNLKFRLHIPLTPRKIRPHPYTNQDVVALARGPIIYCLEDADNKWVNDHFKSLVWDPSAKVTEEIVVDEQHAEQYVKLAATGNFKKTVTKEASPESYTVPLQETDRLVYIPYYYRANRGGSGQMRVAVRCG